MAGKLIHGPVANAAAAVQSELLIVSPYFIPGDDGMQLFRALRKRNVRVRVLTNSLESAEDESLPLMAYAGYAHYRLPLLEAGVELYEVRPVLGKPKGSGGRLDSEHPARFGLHAKVFLFDRRRLFIGSMNFDQRSMRLNTEIGLIVDSPELARQTAARFEAIAQPANSYVLALRPDAAGGSPQLLWRTEIDGNSVQYASAPARDAWQRTRVNFFSLLSFDDEL
jgi:putative cardiolipin synthase